MSQADVTEQVARREAHGAVSQSTIDAAVSAGVAPVAARVTTLENAPPPVAAGYNDVTWTTLIGVATSPDSNHKLTKASNDSSFRDGGVSGDIITDEGSLRLILDTAPTGSNGFGFGLSNGTVYPDPLFYNPTQYCLLLSDNAGANAAYQNSNNVTSAIAATVGDWFEFVVKKNAAGTRVVTLWKNGVLILTFSAAPVMPLKAAGVVYSQGKTLGRLQYKTTV